MVDMNGGKPSERLRSHQWYGTDGLRSFSHRARTRQLGYLPEEHLGKPVIAILNTWSDINPCHVHLRDRAQAVKRGVWQAGGFPSSSRSPPSARPSRSRPPCSTATSSPWRRRSCCGRTRSTGPC
ncbi:hypothetical protein SHKM778_68530 [Streptomyces sp. KM77-8]|uniref:Dihydroxy-acid/6-phosphogluconate dehydratase N-terminal domain-containing protein n=1 Tax=Streptomyces haneummycinicus TaxID=3074435 RepID=A0AAT9HSI8_9ACTN